MEHRIQSVDVFSSIAAENLAHAQKSVDEPAPWLSKY
jgi:hypothetical protein